LPHTLGLQKVGVEIKSLVKLTKMMTRIADIMVAVAAAVSPGLNHHSNSHHKSFSYFPANFQAEKVQIKTQGRDSVIGRQFSSHCRLSVQDLKWRLSCQDDPAAFLFARSHPAKFFSSFPIVKLDLAGFLLSQDSFKTSLKRVIQTIA
jgi:hypothetical protein